ncbi:MAG: EpsI family protein, partial [bacterium]|nr:EpsI family protein [bacterium]
MRIVAPFRLSLLIALLVVTSLLAHATSGTSRTSTAKESLSQVFGSNNSWRLVGNHHLDASIVNELMLDDYLFQSYARNSESASLYIGYYRTAKKVGAAHDPLVCFQGQGWQIKDREKGEYILSRNPELKISYSAMIAERSDERQLIVYWFQANRRARANSHSEKGAMIMDAFFGRGEDNAF